jgi:hypothetical protein
VKERKSNDKKVGQKWTAPDEESVATKNNDGII